MSYLRCSSLQLRSIGALATRLDRDILALPVRLGGLGMTNPCLDANLEQSSSVKVTIPLVQQIVAQSHQMPDDSLVKPLQQAMRSERATALQDRAEHIRGVAPQKVQRALDLAAEKRVISLADGTPPS